MEKPDWYKPRHYGHFDSPVSPIFASQIDEAQVRNHVWSPHIKYTKVERRYKRIENKTVLKPRPIMYASHRDACILSRYNHSLCQLLEEKYRELGLSDCVAAYRSIGKSNYHFAKEAQDYVRSQAHVAVLCFDVHGFFDHLDHTYLKRALIDLLGTDS